jgi:hypothetical protein
MATGTCVVSSMMRVVRAVNSSKVDVRFWRRSLSSCSSPPMAKTSSCVRPFMRCRSAILVARMFNHSPSHGGSGSWQIVALTKACAAWTGFRIMVVKTRGAASMPAVILVRRWTMRTTRTGALTKAAGVKDLTWREARSTQAQNKASSNSDKDIVEGGEQVGQDKEADKGIHIYTLRGFRRASEGIFYGSLREVPEQTNLFSLSIDCAQDRTPSR